MEFEVTRTSIHDHARPCPEAEERMVEQWDERTFKSPEEHDARFPSNPWLSRGRDHQLVHGPRGGVVGIRRRVDDRKAWFVEIESIDGLLAFMDKHGAVVLSRDGTWPELEIYDDYRE